MDFIQHNSATSTPCDPRHLTYETRLADTYGERRSRYYTLPPKLDVPRLEDLPSAGGEIIEYESASEGRPDSSTESESDQVMAVDDSATDSSEGQEK
jgi:hypothetical protein